MTEELTVEVPGGALIVTARGDGLPVLLHPSLGRPASDFDDLAGALAANGFRALAIDPRGVGRSTGELGDLTLAACAHDLVRVADRCGLRQVDAIGHAFGNRVVRQLAATWPGLVRRIVLLGAGGRFEGDEAARSALTRCFGPPEPAAEHLAAVGTAFFSPVNDPSVWAGGWHRAAATAQAAASRSTPVDDWWDGGSAPMLVVQGLDDRVAPPENGRALSTQRPSVTLVELEHAGHALLPEQPGKIASATIDFLR